MRPQGFQEGRIRFPPTFKFVPGSSEYSSSRVPSWTDRVLWKVAASQGSARTRLRRVTHPLAGADSAHEATNASVSVHQCYYYSVPGVLSSDHKPVVAGFDVLLNERRLNESKW
jgi:phosphatidylinositol-bisphosphatase